jgi:hypothetical protein
VVSEEPVSVRVLQPKAPGDLEAICHKCLEKDPAPHAGAAELASLPALAKMFSDLAVALPPEGGRRGAGRLLNHTVSLKVPRGRQPDPRVEVLLTPARTMPPGEVQEKAVGLIRDSRPAKAPPLQSKNVPPAAQQIEPNDQVREPEETAAGQGVVFDEVEEEKPPANHLERLAGLLAGVSAASLGRERLREITAASHPASLVEAARAVQILTARAQEKASATRRKATSPALRRAAHGSLARRGRGRRRERPGQGHRAVGRNRPRLSLRPRFTGVGLSQGGRAAAGAGSGGSGEPAGSGRRRRRGEGGRQRPVAGQGVPGRLRPAAGEGHPKGTSGAGEVRELLSKHVPEVDLDAPPRIAAQIPFARARALRPSGVGKHARKAVDSDPVWDSPDDDSGADALQEGSAKARMIGD